MKKKEWIFIILGVVIVGFWWLLAGKAPAKQISPLKRTGSGASLEGETIRILFVGDPFVNAFQACKDKLQRETGASILFDVLPYADTQTMVFQNARDAVSSYDLICYDVIWMGELVSHNVLMPLDKTFIANPELEASDFFPITMAVNTMKGQLYGLPIQPHSEMFWYRKDLFQNAGLAMPRTTDEVLAAAKRFNDPEHGFYGICWNAHRGVPLGQTMMHMYAAFGQSELLKDGQPNLNTPAGVQAGRYLLELKKYSPPDILSMAWDHLVQRYSNGQTAMTYGWGARHVTAEHDPLSRVAGKTGYVGAPTAVGVKPITPFGQWSIGIPANIGVRKAVAEKILLYISKPATMRALALQGDIGTSRYSLCADPTLRALHPVYDAMMTLSQEGALSDSMRPRIAQTSALSEILGTVFHDMLKGELTPEQAAEKAQAQAELLFKKN